MEQALVSWIGSGIQPIIKWMTGVFWLFFVDFRVQLQRGTNKPPDGEEGKGASLDGNNQVY